MCTSGIKDMNLPSISALQNSSSSKSQWKHGTSRRHETWFPSRYVDPGNTTRETQTTARWKGDREDLRGNMMPMKKKTKTFWTKCRTCGQSSMLSPHPLKRCTSRGTLNNFLSTAPRAPPKTNQIDGFRRSTCGAWTITT